MTEPVKKTGEVTGGAIGLTGLNRTAGLGLVDEEFLSNLRGQAAMKVFTEMWMNDPIISAMLFAIDMFMRKTKWNTEAAGDGDKEKADEQFLAECMEDMSHTWPDLLSEINSMLPYGWSFFEILYKRRTTQTDSADVDPPSKYDDGKIGWRKIEIRAQTSFERWEFDEEGGIAGMSQRPAPTYERRTIPIQKALLFRTTSRKNNPEGVSVLRSAYRPWYFKKRTEEIEGVGIERDLAGLPMAKVPSEFMGEKATEAQKKMLAAITNLVSQVRRDQAEGIIWPSDKDANGNELFEFKLLNSGGSRQFSTDQVITRYEQRMAMTVLADFILLGNDSSGSFALGVSKAGMFQSALTAWMDGIEAVFNNYAIPRLFRLNGIKGPYPKIRHEDVQKPSIADLGTFVAALTGAGAQLFPDIELENSLRETAKLPLRGEDNSQKKKEDVLRDEKVNSDIEVARATGKQAKKGILPSGGGINPMLGKQPGSVPGAPTPTTGPVKSKLPPQQRRRTAAVNASENVRKEVIKKVETKRYIVKRGGLKVAQKCKYGDEPATKAVVHSEGMAYVPTCEKHMGKAKDAAARCLPYGGFDMGNIDRIAELPQK